MNEGVFLSELPGTSQQKCQSDGSQSQPFYELILLFQSPHPAEQIVLSTEFRVGTFDNGYAFLMNGIGGRCAASTGRGVWT